MTQSRRRRNIPDPSVTTSKADLWCITEGGHCWHNVPDFEFKQRCCWCGIGETRVHDDGVDHGDHSAQPVQETCSAAILFAKNKSDDE